MTAHSLNPEQAHAGGWLSIDLDAVIANYRFLTEKVAPARCGAVVKADAYGLGAASVAPALVKAGCRDFFVGPLCEGITLRQVLGPGPDIYVLNGLPPDSETDFVQKGLIPVLNSIPQIRAWCAFSRCQPQLPPAAVQIDSGMARFGLDEADIISLARSEEALKGLDLKLIISHLACADEPEHPANLRQRERFAALCALFPLKAPRSLCASSGLFLGAEWRLDLVRPGLALYGGNPTPGHPNPMRPVVSLVGRVAQLRTLPPGSSVGYGSTFTTTRHTRTATVNIGYADGFFRALSNGRASATLAGHEQVRLPVLGRISMDSLVVDITELSGVTIDEGTPLTLLGNGISLEEVAQGAGTIAYEILTALGARYHRRYVGG